MNDYKKLTHTTWECKYHLVWIPKYRKKMLYGNLRIHLGEVFKELALHKESEILEGHLMGDHVHSVPRSGVCNEQAIRLHLTHAV